MPARNFVFRDGLAASIAQAATLDETQPDMRSGVPRRADDAIALIQKNHSAIDDEWLPGLGDREGAQRHVIEDDRRRERLATIGNFAAGVAHEINNPLGAVLTSIQAALTLLDVEDYGAVRECLDNAQHGSRRCIDVVRGLLRFCRDEPAHRITFDLCEICRFAVSLTRSYAQDAAVAWS
ncbi:MAG: histidine kinase dimerization/phospho-acceptor domain-containing protein [Pirellulales bacterium]